MKKATIGIELIVALRGIEEQINIIHSDTSWAAYSQKSAAYNKICEYLESCPNANRYYQLVPNAHFYVDRVKQIKKYDISILEKNATGYTILENTTLDDGIDYFAPDDSGLYFIGETHFNPITDQKYYCVKIGRASNIANRMKQYNTHNPMLWRIDYAIDEENFEAYYQSMLTHVALARCSHNAEWFFVDKVTYLEMCAKGFHYFDDK